MTFVEVNQYEEEFIYNGFFYAKGHVISVTDCIELPKGTIAKLIGRELTWEDEPVMIE